MSQISGHEYKDKYGIYTVTDLMKNIKFGLNLTTEHYFKKFMSKSRAIFLILWKQFVLTSKKALKKKQFHPENTGNGICETLNFKIFLGEDAPGPPPPTTLAATPLLGQTNTRPPPKKNFLTTTPMTLHAMIKFSREYSPKTPLLPNKRW